MPLYHKQRPATFEEFRGNRATVEALRGVLGRKDDVPHAFMFVGPSGTGKTTLARIVARELGVKSEFDLTEYDAADFRGIDTIRELKRAANVRSMTAGGVRVWIIDECHKLTNDAQNAMLKLLEDSPPSSYFILCTTDDHKLLNTIHTRCSRFETSPLTNKQMTSLLDDVVKSEKRKVPDEAIEMIVNSSEGSARQALTTLDTIIDMEPERMIRVAAKSKSNEKQSIDLCRALMNGKTSWNEVSSILNGMRKGCEPESVRRHVLGFAASVILGGGRGRTKADPAAGAAVVYQFQDNFFDSGFAGLCYACWECKNS